MNTIVKITSLLLCVFLCNACSNNEKNYDVYINNEGYNLEEEIYVEVNLKTSNDNINVCPILKVEKEGEEDISEIADSITFSTDSVEFMNLYPVEFSEKYNDGYWSFETQLSNDGEDIDLSIRIFKHNYSCRLFPRSWVYHKRRTDFCKFFKQVHNSGIARINLYKRYPDSLKLVHFLHYIWAYSI